MKEIYLNTKADANENSSENENNEAVIPNDDGSDDAVVLENENSNDNEEKKDKKKWIIIILLILLLLLLLRSCRSCSQEPTQPENPITEGVQWDGKTPLSGKNSSASSEGIDIIGYSDIYLNKDMKTVSLINPKTNTVYFKYVISDENGNVLIETDFIPPDRMVEKDMYSLLSKGEHNLTFAVSTYDITTQEPCNGAITQVRFVVE